MSRFGVPGDPFARFERQRQEERWQAGFDRYRRNAAIFAALNCCPPWWKWTVYLAVAMGWPGRAR